MGSVYDGCFLAVALVFGLIEMVGVIIACTLGDRIHRAKHYHRFD